MTCVLSRPACRGLQGLALLALALGLVLAPAAGRTDGLPPPDRLLKTSTEDLPAMTRRRTVRALVTYNTTEYFVVKGQQRGFEYELLEQYEKYLNDGRAPGQLEIELIYIPMPFERLLPALLEGRGDIAAAGITVTAERARKVAFTIPYVTDVSEVVVAHRSVKGLTTLDDLAGRTLYVLRGSSYEQHLRRLNLRFADSKLAPMRVIESDPHLSTEDILELVNARVLDLTISDHHIAELWAKVLPNIDVRTDLAINDSGSIAWAVRKNNPELLKSLNGFLKENKRGTLIGNVLFERYFGKTRWISNPLSEADSAKLTTYRSLFKKYAKMYGFDWPLVAAVAYQESRLEPNRKSHKGAVGLMQIRPATARGKNVGIDDIEDPENNVHAGVKYLAFLRDHYYSASAVSDEDRIYLSLAAYNAGPRKVKHFRKIAADKGLDPNRWFSNVERAALEVVGQETVRYVSNIYKYYIAYSQLLDIAEKKARAIESKTR